ncbi:MAG: hypothetical protein L0287_25355, partial [Anaerolineae bacterium]|nr:hypothetical protein [Anaerolineae bacterium]
FETQPTPRWFRKDAVQANLDIRSYRGDSNINIVNLRRNSAPGRDTQNQRPIEWSCQWIVSGHIRNQYYPSEDAHRLIYIAPYAKGPEDKPFKPTVYRVIQ